jgi:hypothetical protein
VRRTTLFDAYIKDQFRAVVNSFEMRFDHARNRIKMLFGVALRRGKRVAFLHCDRLTDLRLRRLAQAVEI